MFYVEQIFFFIAALLLYVSGSMFAMTYTPKFKITKKSNGKILDSEIIQLLE